MTLDSLLNGMKSLFSSLGAKTSDSNYGVALLDKTSGEPKGLMGMSDLASVLGVMKWQGNIDGVNTPVDTGISVNAQSRGETLLVLCSGHSATGNSTTSAIYMLRLGYDGNNMHTSEIVKDTGSNTPGNYFTFGVSSNGTLTIAGPHGGNYVKVISNR